MVLIVIKVGRCAFPVRTCQQNEAGMEERGMQEKEKAAWPCAQATVTVRAHRAQLHIRQLMRLERSRAVFPFPEAMEELSHPCPT